jgi:hypothetical protein
MPSPPHIPARLVLTAVAAVVLIAGASGTRPAAQAQEPEQSWLRIDTLQVIPEKWDEYREIERDEVIPALRAAGVANRAAWRTAEFGSTYEMVLVRPIADFADYDTGDSFSRALGPREAERLRERLRRCLLRRDSAAILQRSDLSVGETGRPFAVVTTLDIAPGRSAEYETFLRETLPSVSEAGVAFGVYQRLYGQPNAWLLVQNLDSLAELTLPSGINRAFGPQAAGNLFQGLAGIVTGVERKVFRFDPELSFSFPGSET